MTMRKLAPILLILAASVAVTSTVATARTSTAKSTTRTVKVGDDYFVGDGKARTVTVKRNTRVRWKWAGNSAHDVTVRKGPVKFRSPVKSSGTYSRKMTRIGTYRIYCSIHGAAAQSMTLKVVR